MTPCPSPRRVISRIGRGEVLAFCSVAANLLDYAYSPLQHVRPGTAYPAVLFTASSKRNANADALLLITAENDPRVASWQSRGLATTTVPATAPNECSSV